MFKSKLRKKILKLREMENFKNIKIDFDNVFDLLKKNNLTKKCIGGYFPVNYEIDDLEILKKLKKKKYQISLPIIKKNFDMDFYSWSFVDPLKINQYGIPEPLHGKTIEINSLDLIIVPLVAFDMKGNRIGMGQGFYDITLNKYKPLIPKLIGLGYDFQEELTCFPENHDIKLDGALTPSRIIEF